MLEYDPDKDEDEDEDIVDAELVEDNLECSRRATGSRGNWKRNFANEPPKYGRGNRLRCR